MTTFDLDLLAQGDDLDLDSLLEAVDNTIARRHALIHSTALRLGGSLVGLRARFLARDKVSAWMVGNEACRAVERAGGTYPRVVLSEHVRKAPA